MSMGTAFAKTGFKEKESLPHGLEIKLDKGKELPKPFLGNCIVDKEPQVAAELTYNLSLSKETLLVNEIITFLLTVENNSGQPVAKEYSGPNYSIIVKGISNYPESQTVWQYYGPYVSNQIFEPGFSTVFYGGTFKPAIPGTYSVTAYFTDEYAGGTHFYLD